MESWWSLGDWSGFRGSELATNEIVCPFCGERGNWSVEFSAQKKQPNGHKVLHYDTLKCGSCASYVQAFWSAGFGLHDFRVQPWPLKVSKAPEHWPEAIGRYWLQAKRNIKDESWDAAAVMARSALQLSLRDQGATGRTLQAEIEDLASKGVLPSLMRDWAHEVRALGNDSAHPAPSQEPTEAQDARDIVQFLDFFLEYSYSLPKKINDYRARRSTT
ncbi:DUF4145 domain-containing protein [Xanthomonas sp. LMG 12459]|uniref:DUF4145 domain-containing protein n=1 Tax=Xanthomonas sp. LMG 12459 TaxID=1591131 RepID=UPI00126320EB|nr:DUF4145 domain-containing protein [Xanthomonas sp. LMG 12459]KAB7779071.1 hypothetical protein CEK65_06845 [Xanthomonas sp. LMG 12459]